MNEYFIKYHSPRIGKNQSLFYLMNSKEWWQSFDQNQIKNILIETKSAKEAIKMVKKEKIDENIIINDIRKV